MEFTYVLQYRDAADAAACRFEGDPAPPAAASGPAQLLGWAVVLACSGALFLLLSRDGDGAGRVRAALSEADRVNHPAFVAGVLLSAIGAALVVVPCAYVLARRRSAGRCSTRPR